MFFTEYSKKQTLRLSRYSVIKQANYKRKSHTIRRSCLTLIYDSYLTLTLLYFISQHQTKLHGLTLWIFHSSVCLDVIQIHTLHHNYVIIFVVTFQCYTNAIELQPDSADYYLKRCFAYLKLENIDSEYPSCFHYGLKIVKFHKVQFL